MRFKALRNYKKVTLNFFIGKFLYTLSNSHKKIILKINIFVFLKINFFFTKKNYCSEKMGIFILPSKKENSRKAADTACLNGKEQRKKHKRALQGLW
jgi:hypothetical protein